MKSNDASPPVRKKENPQGNMHTFLDAVSAVRGERRYQVVLWEAAQVSGIHRRQVGITAFLIFMQDYINEALHTCSRPGPGVVDEVLATVRKIAATAVACMEENGVRFRDHNDFVKARASHGLPSRSPLLTELASLTKTAHSPYELCICGHKFVAHGMPGTTCLEQPWLPEDITPCLCSRFVLDAGCCDTPDPTIIFKQTIEE